MARPKKAEGEKLQFDTIGLRKSDWEYVCLYMPGGNPTTQVSEAIEALRRLRPAGPNGFGHAITARPRQRVPYKEVDAYAQSHALTRTEAVAQLVKAGLAKEAIE